MSATPSATSSRTDGDHKTQIRPLSIVIRTAMEHHPFFIEWKSPVSLLQTANLTIVPCKPEDSADFIALEGDPEVMRFLTGGRIGALMQSSIEDTYLRPRGTEPHVWTARRTRSGSFVGWFCLWPEDAGVAELGYRLRRAEWGQGLAPEGASALIDWGFNIAGYDKIIASTMATNRASRRVLEKCGLEHIRTVQVDWAEAIPGGEQGESQYEQTRTGWFSASRGP